MSLIHAIKLRLACDICSWLALSALCLVITGGVAGAATYYVSPTGSNTLSTNSSSPGSLGFALAGTGGGAGAAQSGDTVILENGTYDGAPNGIYVYNSNVTLQAQKWHGAIVKNSVNSSLIGGSGSNDICQGIVFGPATTLGWSGGGNDAWQFLDCEFVSEGGIGSGDNTLFLHDVFSDAYSNAIDLAGTNQEIKNSILRRSNRASGDSDAVGNKMDYTTNLTVDGLVDYDSNGAGLWYDTANDGWIVENSTFFANHGGNNWYYMYINSGSSKTTFNASGQDGVGFSIGQGVLGIAGTAANIGAQTVVTAVNGSNITVSPALPAVPQGGDQFAAQQGGASVGDAFITEANDDGTFTNNVDYSNTDNGVFDHSSGGTTYGGTGGIVVTNNLFAYNPESFFVWSDQRDTGPAIVEYNVFKFLPGSSSAFDSWGSTPGAYPYLGQITFDYNDYDADNGNGDWAVWYTNDPPPSAGRLTADAQPSDQDYLQNPATWNQDFHSNTNSVTLIGTPPSVYVWPAGTDTNWKDDYFPNNTFGLSNSIHQIDDTDGAIDNTIDAVIDSHHIGDVVTIPVSAHTPLVNNACEVYDLNGRWVSLTVSSANQSEFLAAVPSYVTCKSGNATQTYDIKITLDSLPPYNVAATYNPSGVVGPSAPTLNSATPSIGKVALAWSASTGATSYSVLRSTTSGSGYTSVVTGLTTTTYSDTSVTDWTPYYYVVTASNSSATSGYSNQLSATPTGGPYTGSLSGTGAAASTSTYNLTSLGTSDWAQWGDSSFEHKSSGGGQISDVTRIGGGNYGSLNGVSTWNTSWTDGAPTASASDNQTGLWCNDVANAGWTFTAPADTTTRTLSILLGGASTATIKINAHLSDDGGHSKDYTSTITLPGNNSSPIYLYTLTYAAASAGQTIVITLTNTAATAPSVDLEAAWLSASAPPAPVSSVTLNPIKVLGGHSSTGTVTLASAAPAGGEVVTLSSSNPSAATTPASVTVAAGAKTATFHIGSTGVQATTNVTISATAGSVTKTASLEVTFAIFRISFSPDDVPGGHTSTGTVTVSAPAPANLTIDFKSSNAATVLVPRAIVIPAGATQGLFKCYTVKPTVATVVSIEAYANGAGHLSEDLTVEP